jgi:hypothetical protein
MLSDEGGGNMKRSRSDARIISIRCCYGPPIQLLPSRLSWVPDEVDSAGR